MDLNFTQEELAFRDEARHFFRTAIPESIRAKVAEGEGLTRDDMILSQRTLNQHGWATPNWPVEWGGKAWSPVQVYLYQDEMQQANVPAPIPFNVSMVGPVIAQFASQELKERFLPATANADIFWCQGFSEPGSGSDLASLRTGRSARATNTSSTARRSGPRWRNTPTGFSAWSAPTRR
jgi:alkylation response protein AidB-like acyl-CoA dehydrogenase